MTWQLFDTTVVGNQSQILLDDQYLTELPGEELPTLAWFGVWCQQDTNGHYWNPTETDTLDAIEKDLLGLVSQHGNGWAVYVRRAVSAGKREYFFYCGEETAVHQALPAIQALYPEYRIEFDIKPDPQWTFYTSWLKQAPNN